MPLVITHNWKKLAIKGQVLISHGTPDAMNMQPTRVGCPPESIQVVGWVFGLPSADPHGARRPHYRLKSRPLTQSLYGSLCSAHVHRSGATMLAYSPDMSRCSSSCSRKMRIRARAEYPDILPGTIDKLEAICHDWYLHHLACTRLHDLVLGALADFRNGSNNHMTSAGEYDHTQSNRMDGEKIKAGKITRLAVEDWLQRAAQRRSGIMYKAYYIPTSVALSLQRAGPIVISQRGRLHPLQVTVRVQDGNPSLGSF